MPMKPMTNCTYKGCARLAKPGNGGLCDYHKKKRNEAYNKSRYDNKYTAVYKKKAWQLARKAALIRDSGWCVMCKEKPADVVDHIIELKDGGCAYCVDNLQSLCNSCHAKKTHEVARQRNFMV